MGEREHAAAPAPAERAPARQQVPPATALQQAVGNRALGRMLQRAATTADAVKELETTLKPGVLGAQQHVVDTLKPFSMDAKSFDEVHIDYEKKTETPLAPSLPPGVTTPDGYFPGISGKKAE